MKKFLALLGMTALVMALCSCGSSEKTYTQSEVDKMMEDTSKDSAEEEVFEEAAEVIEEKEEETKNTTASSQYYKKNEEIKMFESKATIDETVLVDEADVKITATSLEYGDYTVDVLLTLENNSDKELKFTAGTVGYSKNSVNGYSIEQGYINTDITPGNKAVETVSFSNDELMMYGIKEIAEIGLSCY